MVEKVTCTMVVILGATLLTWVTFLFDLDYKNALISYFGLIMILNIITKD